MDVPGDARGKLATFYTVRGHVKQVHGRVHVIIRFSDKTSIPVFDHALPRVKETSFIRETISNFKYIALANLATGFIAKSRELPDGLGDDLEHAPVILVGDYVTAGASHAIEKRASFRVDVVLRRERGGEVVAAYPFFVVCPLPAEFYLSVHDVCF
jgi:hypothetical protein